jgi:hypothetical protein
VEVADSHLDHSAPHSSTTVIKRAQKCGLITKSAFYKNHLIIRRKSSGVTFSRVNPT